LLDIRKELANLRYLSDEAIETVVMEYLKAQSVFREFMEWAISNDFENIFQDMIYLLHFIQDIQHFRTHNPDALFMEYARCDPDLMEKVQSVLRKGLYSFLDYVIELKEKQPGILNDLLADYQATEHMKQSSARLIHNRRFLDRNTSSFSHRDCSSGLDRRTQSENRSPLPEANTATCNDQNADQE
jgi:Zn-dependent M32 family carboxypeptidase